MSLKPKKKTTLSAKIGKKKIELRTTILGGISEHEVVISEGKKKKVEFERDTDLVVAIRAWKEEVNYETSKYESEMKTKQTRLIDNNEAVLTALKEVWINKKSGRERITANEIEKHLTTRLDIKEATQHEVAVAIRRLEDRGFIQISYHSGLPMHGPGLDGDSNKRLLKIKFRE